MLSGVLSVGCQMYKSRLFVSGLALVAFLTSPVMAATVQVGTADLSINPGTGFHRIAGTTQAKPGDKVMASPEGSGQIIYEDGCIVQVKPGSVVAIVDKSPCAYQQQAFKLGAGQTDGVPLDHYYIIGAVVVGGAIAAGVLLSQDHDKGASP